MKKYTKEQNKPLESKLKEETTDTHVCSQEFDQRQEYDEAIMIEKSLQELQHRFFLPLRNKNRVNLDSPFFMASNIKSLAPGRRLCLLKGETPGETFLVVEPLTLAWVAILLAEGAINALGGKIFDQLFNAKLDLVQLQYDTLTKVAQIIHEEIQANAFRECNAMIDEVTTIMRCYVNSPATSLDRLYYASGRAQALVSNLKSLGFKAILPFCTAVGLLINILQERLQRFNEQGEKKNIVDLLTTSLDHAKTSFEELSKWNESRFGELRACVARPGQIRTCTYKYTLDNRWVRLTGSMSSDQAIQKRKEHIQSECAQKFDAIAGSSWDVAYDWSHLKLVLSGT